MRCVAARLGLQTGQARLGARHRTRVLAARLGLQTGQARLGARLVFVGTVPEFLNGGELVRRLAAAVSL